MAKITAKPKAKETFSYKVNRKIKEKAAKVAEKKKTTLSTLIAEFVEEVSKKK